MTNLKVPFLLSGIILLCLFPLVSPIYYVSVLSEILIFGIFAISLNILIGYTGLVSLGHAAFFGVGAYAGGIIAKEISSNLFLTLAGALLCSMIAAAIIGFFSTRVSGFYFLMITLAFSQMVYAMVYQWTRLTGGSNGLSAIPKPSLLEGVVFSDAHSIYFLILFLFILVFFAVRILINSPLGHIFIGIKENEARMKASGYNTTFYKNLSFIIAGSLGGFAGCLYSYFNGFVSPSDAYWVMSGQVLIMVLVGGVGTLMGPVIGAAFIFALELFVGLYTDMWKLVVGIVFILFVVFIPEGIAGFFHKRFKAISLKRNRGNTAVNESTINENRS